MSLASKILSLVEPKPAEQTAAIVASVGSKLTAAREAESIAVAEHGAALLAAESGMPSDTTATGEALAKARRLVEDLTVTLSAAKTQHEAAQSASKSDELAARWKRAGMQAARALSVAREVEAAANTLAEKLAELNKLNAELFDMAPARDADAPYASGLHHTQTEKAIRQHLRHKNIAWAYTIAWDADGKPWGAPNARGFTERLADAHAILLAGQRENV